jgi:hypothetical protein
VRRLAILAALALAAGCGGPVRKSEVWLGKNASLSVDGKSVSVNGDGPTKLEIPLAARNTIRVSEPLKATVVEDVTTLVNPPGDAEDRLFFNSSANTTIVHTGEKGAIAGPTDPQALFPDPIARLRDDRGPFFCPPFGQGILVTASDWRATVTVDGRFRYKLEAAADATKETPWSKPYAIELDAGRHTLEVARTGLRPYVVDVVVRTGEYVYEGVRLAPERRRAGDD